MDFAKWLICIANADQNLSYYVKKGTSFFKFGKSATDRPCPAWASYKRKSKKRWEWGKKHLAFPSLTLELTGKQNNILYLAVGAVADTMERHGRTTIFHAAL